MEATDSALLADSVRRVISEQGGLPMNSIGSKELRKEMKEAASKKAGKDGKHELV